MNIGNGKGEENISLNIKNKKMVIMNKLLMLILPILIFISIGFSSAQCNFVQGDVMNWPEESGNQVIIDASRGSCSNGGENNNNCTGIFAVYLPKASADMPQLVERFNISGISDIVRCVGDCKHVFADVSTTAGWLYPRYNATRGGRYWVSLAMQDLDGVSYSPNCNTPRYFDMTCKAGEFTCSNNTRSIMMLVGLVLSLMFIGFAGYKMFESGDFNSQSIVMLFGLVMLCFVVLYVLFAIMA
jgi:hypothetical protein